jgi:hypothetical protein
MFFSFLVIKIPKFTGLISHLNERSFLSYLELLLKHFLFSFGRLRRVIRFNYLRHIDLDHNIVDVGSYLSTITLRGLSSICCTTRCCLLLFTLDFGIILSEHNNLLVDETLHAISDKFLPSSFLKQLLRSKWLHLSLLLLIVLHFNINILRTSLILTI